MCIASVMEFAGSLAVGARVADTIRTKVIDVDSFEAEPAVLMLAMTCAIIGSSLYLTCATKIGLPVSTTHSIMGGVIGVGIASLGAGGVHWGWNGVSQVFAAWAIAPGISGIFGAILFLVTKYGVMLRADPVRAAFISVPFYFFLTSGLLSSKSFPAAMNDMETDLCSAYRVEGGLIQHRHVGRLGCGHRHSGR